ncbi:MAG: hypothetical protein OER92_08215, partial [Alphaproteobacteria bacterium]|nr:hypothetical protein [Alphaproteobacteria bacterium]
RLAGVAFLDALDELIEVDMVGYAHRAYLSLLAGRIVVVSWRDCVVTTNYDLSSRISGRINLEFRLWP